MSKKLRVTGFTRFILFLLIIAPLAYFGASYYNGEDGFQNVKDMVNQGIDKTRVKSEAPSENLSVADLKSLEACKEERERLEKRMDRKDRQIDDLQDEVEALKTKLKKE